MVIVVTNTQIPDVFELWTTCSIQCSAYFRIICMSRVAAYSYHPRITKTDGINFIIIRTTIHRDIIIPRVRRTTDVLRVQLGKTDNNLFVRLPVRILQCRISAGKKNTLIVPFYEDVVSRLWREKFLHLTSTSWYFSSLQYAHINTKTWTRISARIRRLSYSINLALPKMPSMQCFRSYRN